MTVPARVYRWWLFATCAALVGVLGGTSATVVIVARPQVRDEAGRSSGDEATSVGQPIAFSHAHHAGEYQIGCEFCHAYARRGPVAGIPSVQRCVGCHRTILSEQPEILKLLDYWENGTPIPWLRVHDLPDYVRFTHKAHLRAGLECARCHGDVTRMDIAQQVEPLTMGWCVDCHESHDASRDCLVCHY